MCSKKAGSLPFVTVHESEKSKSALSKTPTQNLHTNGHMIAYSRKEKGQRSPTIFLAKAHIFCCMHISKKPWVFHYPFLKCEQPHYTPSSMPHKVNIMTFPCVITYVEEKVSCPSFSPLYFPLSHFEPLSFFGTNPWSTSLLQRVSRDQPISAGYTPYILVPWFWIMTITPTPR